MMEALDRKLIGVIEKLARFGATTEKKLLSMNDRDMISLEMDFGAKAPERLMVIELKEAIQKGRGYSYIMGGLSEEEEAKKKTIARENQYSHT